MQSLANHEMSNKTSVEVYDETGRLLGKIKTGDTKAIALQRLGCGSGGLFDNQNVGVSDTDTITGDEAPYIFKPIPHQSQLLNIYQHQEQVTRRSLAIMDAWCHKLQVVPTAEEVSNVVQAALPMPLPSPHPVSALDRPEEDVILVKDTETVIIPELGRLRDSIYTLPKIGNNEDSVHSLVDALILIPMQLLGRRMKCNLRMNRNGSDSSGATIQNLRPDVLVWLPSGVLAFKGEDKASESEIHLARNELCSKLSCFADAFFGRVPYQICYAAGGSMLEFFLISRCSSGRPALVSLFKPIDLDTVNGRSLCVRCALNITRILVSLQENFPEGSVVRLGDTITTQNSLVSIFGEYVIKKTRAFTEADTIQSLYSQIQSSTVPGIISPESFGVNRGSLTVQISPVGFCGKIPQSAIEVQIAGRRLLEALQWLHGHGWVHRDIRSANGMFAEGEWFLMDLEWANTSDSPIGNYNPNPDQTPPELIEMEDVAWTLACDMWQFGKLLQLWGHLDEHGLRYVATQIQADPTRRLSATESLDHSFFVSPVHTS